MNDEYEKKSSTGNIRQHFTFHLYVICKELGLALTLTLFNYVQMNTLVNMKTIS